jgi:acetyl esterase/lipase
MRLDRRGLLLGTAGLAAASAARAQPIVAPPDPEEIIRLWPGEAPGTNDTTRALVPEVPERSTDPSYRDRYARYTIEPLMHVMRPERPNGAGLLLIPGGGYRWAVVDKEGMDCARVFAAAGVTCFILRYRLPADGWEAGPDAPLQDAQRAMRLIRAQAAGFGVDLGRIAVLGASAGGHLAGMLSSRIDAPIYEPQDAADAVTSRPDASILMYPVTTMAAPFAHAGSCEHLLGPTPSDELIARYSLQTQVTADNPSTFLLHAMDDEAVPPENGMMLHAALRAAPVPTEAHFFQEGGHGFGIRLIAGRPAAVWPELVLAWGRRNGWLAA